MRLLFGSVLLIHGLIHFLGFLNAYKVLSGYLLPLEIPKSQGPLWLASGLMFILILFLYYKGHDGWWVLGTPVIILSQSLLILNWQEAKFGSVANILILFGCLIGFSYWQHNRAARVDVDRLFAISTSANEKGAIDGKDSPEIVRKWLDQSKALDRFTISKVEIAQTGLMRLSPGAKWLPFSARQWFSTNPPGFIWSATVGQRSSPIQFTGIDIYRGGKGRMLIKLFGLIPVANVSGPEIDQGSMIRFLAESIWFPTFTRAKYLSWVAIDEQSAKATIIYDGQKAEGIFKFNANGDVLSFEANRFYNMTGNQETWFIEIDPESYQNFHGFHVPTLANVSWKLTDGTFCWLALEVEEIKYQ